MSNRKEFMPEQGSIFHDAAQTLSEKLDDLIKFRHDIHGHPDISGDEADTARRVHDYLKQTQPDKIIENIGGAGVAFVYDSGKKGPTVMVRSELDALTIPENLDIPYCSEKDNVSHKCGHDGHMAMVAGLGWLLFNDRPEKGRVVLLYQPSEETGEGSQRIIDDPAFKKMEPDYIFALHNIPGVPLGQVMLKDGVFAAASEGLITRLHGATSHAAHPENGRSPSIATAQIIQEWMSLSQRMFSFETPSLLTVIHARIGEIAFGTSPGEAEVMATIRAHDNEVLRKLSQTAEERAQSLAGMHDLEAEVERTQRFEATVNDPDCNEIIRLMAEKLGYQTKELSHPFSWSEDFGRFTNKYRGAQFGLGSGKKQPQLHHPDFDFPDELIGYGSLLFYAIVTQVLE
ncbi:MAG TPA: amidohydrolase [Balneolales bacterium]|nr:amidohydrolase [Balneolales bacterium]